MIRTTYRGRTDVIFNHKTNAGDEKMKQRLGLGIIPGTGWNADEILAVAREAEDAGFDAIFSAEVNNDAMATAQLMGSATSRVLVGTWVANIYLRHPYVCAQGAGLIADATGGRFVLGLGVSHQPVNQALNVEMNSQLNVMRDYLKTVQMFLAGGGPATHLPQRPATHRVPIYAAALTSGAVEVAGELCDGMMPFLWPASRITRSKVWWDRGRARSARQDRFDVTLGLPTFLGDDLPSLRDAARQNLGLYTTLPFFQRLFRASGFEAEAAEMEKGAGGAALTERLLDAICLIGPAARCHEQLAEFRAAGVDLPILSPPIGVEGARRVIKAFRR